MSVCFILLLITQANEAIAKPIIAPLGENTYLTVNDLKDFKILALTLIVISGLNLLKFLASFFSSERKELNSRVKDLEDMTNKIYSKMDQISLSIAQIKDGQVSESEVRKITRDELIYLDSVQKRRNQ